MHKRVLGLGAALLSLSVVLPASHAFAQAATLGGPAPGGVTIDVAAATAPRTLGKPDAPVVIEEFASLSCPHCAHFEETMLPRLKAEFIDAGQVLFVFHDTPTNRVGYMAHLATRCLPAARYNDARSLLFSTQAQWLGAKDPETGLKDMMAMVGLPGPAYDACTSSRPLQDYVAKSSQEATEQNIEKTPTVIIRKGGKEVARIAGPDSYDSLAAALVKAGAKPPAKKPPVN
ncbi:thioredoxin domain-containing protein [Nitrospirillum iridis]|uniref:Protein-disulfide isomerase n=1 Tax=Nitrospirillum iridis TaxID=765888 RepID=A0A7X0B4Y4_9PROT|nr:protein-disulfide isomerase [Nitrospirillum iridis]